MRSKILVAVAALVLASCIPSLGQNKPREANKAVPASFAPAQATPPAKGGAGQASWKQFFADPQLATLIDGALKNNQELNMQLQEILVTKAEAMARTGEYIPSVSAFAGAGLDKGGRYTSKGVSDEAHRVPDPTANYTVGFSASWEVDIWNKLRSAAKAANLRYLASIEGRNFLLTQVVAEIAGSYYELMALDNQLEVLKSNIEIQKSALEIVKLEKQAARATQLAVQRFEAEVLKNRSRLYALEQARVETENRINFLVGRFPQPVTRNAERFKEPFVNTLKAGVPVDLLDNRADVRQAALALEAAKLDVKSARAGFYPALSIEAGVGYEAFNLKHLVATPESLLYNLAGNLVAPLLNRRAIKAQYSAANAQQLQAVYGYERAILSAFTDVANQLAKTGNLQQSYDLQAKQVETLVQSIEISNVLFQSARADYMEVLLTRRDALEAEMELIETKKDQMLTRVHMYQALGGGWR